MRFNKEYYALIDALGSFGLERTKLQVFQDWIKLMTLSISQSVLYDPDREQEYINVMKAYKPDEQCRFTAMMGMLVMAMDCEISDYLGNMYMNATGGYKTTGMYFTPPHISEMMAQIMVTNDKETLIEPSAGSGANILALCKGLKNEGVDFQKSIKVDACDLDLNAVYMTYVQLSIAGVRARVFQGNSLADEREKRNTFYTPMYVRDFIYG